MTYSYFPGCTLKNKAKSLDECGRLSAEALGFTLAEIPEWQCCGGTYPLARDEIATKLSSVRALKAARDAGQDLVTLCAACHNVIKQVNEDMRSDEEIRDRVNAYMNEGTPYRGETNVLHYLEVLRDVVGFDSVAKKVVRPFTGKKIGAYYGCLLLRPGKVMRMDDVENPKIIEDFIRAIGGEPVIYALRNECCGGYQALDDVSIVKKRSGMVLSCAKDHGAEMMVTACPLCQYNLTKQDSGLPVFYFTELLAQALGLKEMRS